MQQPMDDHEKRMNYHYFLYDGSKKKNDTYFSNLERTQIEEELGEEQESQLRRDLKSESDDYNTRLSLNPMYQVESEINASNIVRTHRWKGRMLQLDENPEFSLFDVYVKIVKKKGAFTRHDIIFKLINILFHLRIGRMGEYQVFNRGFIPVLGFELINEQEVLQEENIIFLKVFTFGGMPYGLSNHFYKGTPMFFDIWNTGPIDKLSYDIDVIFSGKNMYLSEMSESERESKKSYQFITKSFTTGNITLLNECSTKKFSIPFEVTDMIWFIMTKRAFVNDDELEETGITSIDLYMKRFNIRFEKDDLIHIQIFGVDFYLLVFDGELRDIRKFKKYINNDFDFDQIPFERLSCRNDKGMMQIHHNTKDSDVFMIGMDIDLVRLGDKQKPLFD